MILFEPCVCTELSWELGASISGVATMINAYYIMINGKLIAINLR